MAETLEQRINSGREYRSMTLEVRADAGEDYQVEGYATTFDEPYTLYEDETYRIREQVAPTAFEGCDMTDVILQYDHQGRVFARRRNGTLQLDIDDHGLRVRADLSGTEAGRQLYQEIKGGYTDRMSFGFTVEEDKREYIDHPGQNRTDCLRTITKIKKLYDVSAVSLPANDGTSISARRSADGAIQQITAERLTRAKNKLELFLLTQED